MNSLPPTPPPPDPVGWKLPRGSLARPLVLRLMPPVLLLVLLDLAATWVITHKIDMSIWMLEDFFWLMVVGQIVLIALFTGVIIRGVRSGLRSVNHLAEEIRQRSIDDMQPMEVAGLPAEIAPLVTHINDLLGRLDASLAAQRRFIGHAAHQLRTPLSGLRLESELMLARPLPEDVRMRAERIKAVSDRMIRLGQQLLVMARADPDARPQDRFIRLDLCEWVRASGAEWIPRVRAAQAEIDLVAPEQPVWIDGDPLLLDEMLGNLIDNALRYGKPRGRICLTIGVNPPALIIEDDGPGISPQERDSVFEAFYRAPDAKAGGSGLGLAIVREIAHAHGAWWKLSSRPEYAGTRLSVVFPGPRIGTQLTRQERAS
ncbi:sensor kinase protein [Bordetella pertussis]|nr:ATP-binding protein [Bordetella pertussis]CPL11962.1 sensor kinase protein [Bordetella pertussis]CPL89066.1 sensor kinase protein [Bordetella pertussis]